MPGRVDEPAQGSMPAAPAGAAQPLQTQPFIDGADTCSAVDVGGRNVLVLARMQRPRLVLLGSLFSDAECEELIAAARPRLQRSETAVTAPGGDSISSVRTSDGMFFARGETPLVTRLEARIARLVNWPVSRGEGLQVLHYLPGTEYQAHYDYFDPDGASTPAILQRGGQRVATLIVYLNEPEQGGATFFPDVGLSVLPRRGHAVFFAYDRAHPDTGSLHAGEPVEQGEKWIVTKWLREADHF